MLATDIPTQETGDWVVNPDGTMVTTYRLRENARWHDGAPLTAQDFAFGFEVAIDPDMPIRDRVPETLIAGIETPDDRTLVIDWKEPYTRANLLTFQQMAPLPRHRVEQKYRTNKTSFIFGEEWTSGYVGTGPFRVEQWIPGASMVARAYTDWVLGPPRIETVEIRFIPDARTQLANLMAGEVDLMSSPGIRAPEASVARDEWVSKGAGYIKTWQRQLRFLAYQFREVPNWQRAVADVRARQALLHATDRQGLADVLTHGLSSSADAFINPSDRMYRDVDRVVTKYPYDLNRAQGLFADMGWRRSQPGALLTNASGQTLDVEIWATAGGGGEEEAAILDDNWRMAGINSSIFVIPGARQRDHELRASFPAVNATARSITLDNFVFTSAHLPRSDTRWQGANRGSFMDAEIDRLHNLALATFDPGEQHRAVVALHQRMAEILAIGPLYYNVEVLVASNRLKGPVGEVAEKSGMSWNIFEWEVTD
ncbi:MAG: hypothetical protein GEU73_04550 [Chloroflexi bacterium]|nr:hypothetical protein [Chloroflexota bacterium]